MKCFRCDVALPDAAQFCLKCGIAQRTAIVDWTKGTGFFAGLGAVVLTIGGIAIVAVIAFAVISNYAASHDRVLPLDQVVINSSRVLNDGEGMSLKLASGHYRLEMTASDDGCTVEWLGGSCPATQPMKQITTECQLANAGQLIIRNPTTYGLGAASSVTVKVTRLAF